MTLDLNHNEIDTLISLLDEAVTRGRNRGEYTTHYTMLRGKITDQQERKYTDIVDVLTAQICAGETPETVKLTKAYGITYKTAARLIRLAKERACRHEA